MFLYLLGDSHGAGANITALINEMSWEKNVRFKSALAYQSNKRGHPKKTEEDNVCIYCQGENSIHCGGKCSCFCGGRS